MTGATRHRTLPTRPRLTGWLVAAALATASCASTDTVIGDSPGGASADGATSSPSSGSPALDPSDWSSVLAAASGQTVNWYMYGGDEVLNTFVNGYVAEQLRGAGVTLNQVKLTDTADAINKVLGEVQAGKTTDGSVDMIWVNGENFATGVQADLWDCGWDRALPNAQYVDFDDPAVTTDFGTPVEGCEAVWQQANSALVYDSAALSAADVASASSLLTWAAANPGRLTYPAPPDFTGSMAVRTLLYDTIGGPKPLAGPFDEARYTAAADPLWARLQEIEPTLWRGGETYPQTQAAVEKLYADGEISAFFTYGPGLVGEQVEQGLFPESTREAVLSVGNIANVSFVGIPANAANAAGAYVLANVLQDPATQLALYEAEGIYPGIDVTKTTPDVQQAFSAVPVSPAVLPLEALTVNAQPELASDYLRRIEEDWVAKVQQQ